MTWGFSAQRRAEEFDALVERSSTGDTTTLPDPHDASLLALVGALRAAPDPQPRPEFVADLRARLMAEAATALAPADVSRLQLPARHTRRERRIAAVVGGLVAVGATTSLAVASQSALPGESLYPIKRVIESAHSDLTAGDASKGRLQLAAASNRLDEVAALTQDPGLGDDQRIARTLTTFASQATSGADLLLSDYAQTGRVSSVAALRDFASSSLDRLEAIEPTVPYDARDELVDAASVLAQIDAEAARACPACGGTPIGTIPTDLQAAEQVILPPAPTGPATAGGPSAGASQSPTLPHVGTNVPPGSVLDPSTAPSADPSTVTDPLRQLTDGLTGALTGQASGSSAPTSGPVQDVTKGVGDLLHSVLDPITGQLVPPSQ